MIRRAFILSAAMLTFGACATTQSDRAARLIGVQQAMSPEQAIEQLRAGNARFAQGTPSNVSMTSDDFAAQATGQNPYAIVLACADSRVPLDRIFDANMGDIFGLRVAGNVTTEQLMGSAQYAVAALGTPLFVVLGHSGCGAIHGALEYEHTEPGTYPQELEALLGNIHGSLQEQNAHKGTWEQAVLANVRHQMQLAQEDVLIREAVAAGQMRVIGGVFDIGTGRVEWLEE